MQPVEREPMWDGNLYEPFFLILPILVEREPMWDGNASLLLSYSFMSG